jgi:hypothetical protein
VRTSKKIENATPEELIDEFSHFNDCGFTVVLIMQLCPAVSKWALLAE